MNNIKRKLFTGLTLGCTIAVALVSCDKDGINNYVPERPIGGYSSSKEIAPDNLVGYWSFDGSLTDSIGNLAVANTNTAFAAGKKGQALKGADNGYAVISNAGTVIPALQSYTVSFWMNAPQATDNAKGIFSLNNSKDFWGNLDIYQETYVQKDVPNPDTAFLKVHMNNDAATWKGQFTDAKIPAAIGKWVHIAITYDAATSIYNVYANGQQVGVNTAGNPANTKGPALNGDDPAANKKGYGPLKFVNATSIVFGTWQFETSPSLTTGATGQDWAGNFQGLLDEFRIYNTALTATDVSALYKLESLGR